MFPRIRGGGINNKEQTWLAGLSPSKRGSIPGFSHMIHWWRQGGHSGQNYCQVQLYTPAGPSLRNDGVRDVKMPTAAITAAANVDLLQQFRKSTKVNVYVYSPRR